MRRLTLEQVLFSNLLLFALFVSVALALRAFWVTERLLPRAVQAGYQGFNRSFSRGMVPFRWYFRGFIAVEWLSLAGLLSLHTLAFAGITLLGGGALLALVQAESAAVRLKLSYHRQAWQNFRRSWRTAGALWLLKAGILCMLVARSA